MLFSKRAYLIAECSIVFFAFPFSFYLVRHHIAFKVIPIVALLALVCYCYLKAKRLGQPLWKKDDFIKHLRSILFVFSLTAPFFLLLTYFYFPELFLKFPKTKPYYWVLILILYPLSTFPQELIFRGFFFHRYQSVFSHPLMLIAANGISFGLAHIFYGNWIAPVLCTAGGFLFAYRYQQTGSLLLVSLEHGLWGNFLYTIGLGWFFYSGSIV